AEHGGDRDAGGTVRRKAADAGRDCGKCDSAQAVVGGEREAVAVAGREQYLLAAFPAAPNWADRVDHVARRQPEALRDLRFSGLAAAEPGASLGELRPRSAMNGAADAAARGQHGVGGIND